MNKHFYRDLENLYHEVLAMSATVEEMIDMATLALCERKHQLTEQVISSDRAVDEREVRIEEECLKMLALHQPVASDLRRVATVLKVNNDLERVADIAVNIAERAKSLEEHPAFTIPRELNEISKRAIDMLRCALDALINQDSAAAREVLARDDEVDKLNVEIICDLRERMREFSQVVVPALHCFSASRHFERIADHATNIAEDVIYLVEGDIVRHQHDVALPE